MCSTGENGTSLLLLLWKIRLEGELRKQWMKLMMSFQEQAGLVVHIEKQKKQKKWSSVHDAESNRPR
jgi:hypothetical protein